MQFIYQLGNGYMLGLEGTNFYKVQTGYPYPQLDKSQDELLFDIYCSLVADVSYDKFMEKIKLDFLNKLKTELEKDDLVSLDIIRYGRVIKYRLDKYGDASGIYLGGYCIELENIKSFKLSCLNKSYMASLIVPHHLKHEIKHICKDTKPLSFRGGSNDYAEYIYGISKITAFVDDEIFRDKLELFNNLYNKNLVYVKSLNWTNIFSKGTVTRLDEYGIKKVVDNYISGLNLEVLTNFKNSITIFSRMDRPRINGTNFIFKNVNNSMYMGVTLLDGTDIGDYFNKHILGKFEKFFVKYSKGRVYFDTKKMWGSRANFMISLIKGFNPFGFYLSSENKTVLCNTLGISSKVLTKNSLILGDDSWMARSMLGLFKSDYLMEFNLFLDKVIITNDNSIKFMLGDLKVFYESFKIDLGQSFEEFILSNREYFDYLVQLYNFSTSIKTWIEWQNYKFCIDEDILVVEIKY